LVSRTRTQTDTSFTAAFYDYIGEIALVKDFTSTMDIVMTAEEREAMEAAQNEEASGAAGAGASASASAPASASATSTPAATTPPASKSPKTSLDASSTVAGDAASTLAGDAASIKASAAESSPPGSGHVTPHNKEKAAAAERKAAASAASRNKLTPEQKAKLEELDAVKEVERVKRIEDLAQKLVQRIRPFVDAKKPGDANDPETKAFKERIKTEAEDLKLESFGIEMLHAIGDVYITRSNNFIKSKKFFGGGFLGRLKEKGGHFKQGYGLLSAA
jgi:chemotaxis protein histidine kinase CheA